MTGTRRFTFLRLDIQAPELTGIVAGANPKVIFHLAAQVNPKTSVTDPQFDARNNVLGTINVCEASRQAGVQKIVYAAEGVSRYGRPDRQPVNDAVQVKPPSTAAAGKVAGEMYLHAYAEMYGLEPICLALASVYGPRQHGHGATGVIGNLARAAITGAQVGTHGDGATAHDYVYVDDVVEAFVHAGTISTASSGTYNIGTGQRTPASVLHRLIPASPMELRHHASSQSSRGSRRKPLSMSRKPRRSSAGALPSILLKASGAPSAGCARLRQEKLSSHTPARASPDESRRKAFTQNQSRQADAEHYARPGVLRPHWKALVLLRRERSGDGVDILGATGPGVSEGVHPVWTVPTNGDSGYPRRLLSSLNGRQLPVLGDEQSKVFSRVVRVDRQGERWNLVDPFTNESYRIATDDDMDRVGDSPYAIDHFGRPPDRQLMLTFDDGPDPTFTKQVLDILSQKGSRRRFSRWAQTLSSIPTCFEGSSVKDTWPATTPCSTLTSTSTPISATGKSSSQPTGSCARPQDTGADFFGCPKAILTTIHWPYYRRSSSVIWK